MQDVDVAGGVDVVAEAEPVNALVDAEAGDAVSEAEAMDIVVEAEAMDRQRHRAAIGGHRRGQDLDVEEGMGTAAGE
ncbi:hypothetical protein SESBI_49060 [Sesbania bispinosa]|nr:hypothetical protein SESBI_49060 [Sesbania bispinosa]